MLPIERKNEIIRLIKIYKSVKVNELSEKFDVTEETIRRDLDKLDKEGLLKKTYGGAVLEDFVSEDPSFNDRLKSNMNQKRLIATYASQLIEDGETVFIDMSTTALEVIKNIDTDKKVTVISNSLIALKALSHYKNIKLIGIGGTLNEDTLSMEGPMTVKYIGDYYVDKTIFSVKAISKERGVMDSKERVAEIKKNMISNAKQAILVIDESKFNQSALVKMIELEDVETVVTEYNLDKSWMNFFSENEIEVIIAK